MPSLITIPRASAIALQLGAQCVLDKVGAPIIHGEALLSLSPKLARMFRLASVNAAKDLHTAFTKRHVWPDELSLYGLHQIAEHGFRRAAKLQRRAWRMQSLVRAHRTWDAGTVVLTQAKQRGKVVRVRFGHPRTGFYHEPIAQYLVLFKDRSEVWYWRSELTLAFSVQPLEEPPHGPQQTTQA